MIDRTKFIRKIGWGTKENSGYVECLSIDPAMINAKDEDAKLTDYFLKRNLNSLSAYEEESFCHMSRDNGYNVFFGAAVRKFHQGRFEVFSTRSAWVVISCGDPVLSSQQVLDNFIEKLDHYGICPSYVVSTGEDFNFYFLFDRTFPANDSQWLDIQDALISLGNGNPLAKGIDCFLRVPYTANYTLYIYDDIEIIYGSGKVYSPSAFDQLVNDHGSKSASANPPAPATPTAPIVVNSAEADDTVSVSDVASGEVFDSQNQNMATTELPVETAATQI